MDQYLFFQQHKKYLKDTKSILTPKIFNQKANSELQTYEFNNLTLSRSHQKENATYSTISSSQSKKREDVKFPPIKSANKSTRKINLKNVEPSPLVQSQHNCCAELSCDTMHNCLKMLSGNYTEQYASSGFPPKICALIMKELSSGKANELKSKILDIGCGKGYVGEYLKQDGFAHITGLDCSKNLLQLAEQKKAYEKLEKIAIGEVPIGEQHQDKYDYVISSSMINNDGWDEKVFHQMLDLVKMGGFLIFATKLTLNQDNQYGPEIKKLSHEQYWKFITEHTFFRYDKIEGANGRFSNKKVKIVAYQKTDHNIWVEQERVKREEEERIRSEKQSIIDAKIKMKDDKLNGAQNRQKERKMLKQKKSSMKVAEEQKAAEEAQEADDLAIKAAMEAMKKQDEITMKIKATLKEAMWTKLKAAQADEVARIAAKRLEMQSKLQSTGKKQSFNVGA